MTSKLPLILLLVAVTCLSQFYRVSNSVIAPELVRDLGLSARQLGWAGSAFFFALFAVQLPVGLWFDRFGARLTVSVVSVIAAAGSVWIAYAANATDLIVGRTIVGLGCAASFMSVVFLCARWFEPGRLATAPALFSVGLSDVTCPPSTVYAAYNRYQGAKDIRVYPYNGHEGGQADHSREQLDWLRKLFG